MALPLIPIAAGVLGFGGGFLASNGLNRLFKVGLIAGGVYMAYQVSQQ